MAADIKKSLDSKRLLKQAIVIILMFGCKYLPPIGEMTPYGMSIFFLLVGAVFGWVFLDFVFTNICAIIAFGFTGTFDTLVQCFGACFGSDAAVMMLGSLILCAFIEVMNLTDVIVGYILNLKITKTNTTMFFIMFYIADWAIGAVSHCTLATYLFVTMYRKMTLEADLPPKTKTNSFIICGIALISVFGDIGFPFRATAIAIMGTYEAYAGVPFSFVDYLLYITTYQFVLIVLWVLIGKYIIRIDLSSFKAVEVEKVKATKRQKVGLWCILFMMIAFILTSTSLPLFSYLKLGGVALCTCIVMLIIQVDGKPLLELSEISAKFNWGMYFFIAFFLTFAGYVGSANAGITATFKSWLAPLLSALPPIVFFILAMVLATVLTNVLNNLPVAIIFISIMYALSDALSGINLSAACISIVMASFAACATPAANPPNAIAFSFTDLIDKKMSLKVGTICCIILCVFTIVVYYPFLCLVL